MFVHVRALPRIEHGGRGFLLEDRWAFDPHARLQGAAPKYWHRAGVAGTEIGLPRFVWLGRRIGPRERLQRRLRDEGDRGDLEIDDLDGLGLRHVAVTPLVGVVKSG